MLHKVKEDLFTPHGVITTLFHIAFAVGCFCLIAGFKIYVLGQDPASGTTVKDAVQSVIPRKR